MLGRKKQIVRIEGNLLWQVAQDPDTGRFVGVCQGLNLTAVGETYADFQAAASEALALLLEDLFKDGEFEQFLQRAGWRTMDPLPKRGTPVFDVPFNVQQMPARDVVPAMA